MEPATRTLADELAKVRPADLGFSAESPGVEVVAMLPDAWTLLRKMRASGRGATSGPQQTSGALQSIRPPDPGTIFYPRGVPAQEAIARALQLWMETNAATRALGPWRVLESEAVLGAITVNVCSRPARNATSADTAPPPSTGRPPIARNLEFPAVAGEETSFALQGSDPDRDALTYEIREEPKYGKLSGRAPQLTYYADPGFVGEDRLTYVVRDASHTSSPATVILKVTAAPSATLPQTVGAEPPDLNLNSPVQKAAPKRAIPRK